MIWCTYKALFLANAAAWIMCGDGAPAMLVGAISIVLGVSLRSQRFGGI